MPLTRTAPTAAVPSILAILRKRFSHFFIISRHSVLLRPYLHNKLHLGYQAANGLKGLLRHIDSIATPQTITTLILSFMTSARSIDIDASSHADHSHRLSTILTTVLVALICLFLGFCTSIGSIYRANGSIRDFGIRHIALWLIISFAFYAIVIFIKRLITKKQEKASKEVIADGEGRFSTAILKATRSAPRIALILLICWVWVPIVFYAAYGADFISQLTEFRNWYLATFTGTHVPYHGASLTEMDVYPIAHYLWPATPTFFSNQNNFFLTFFYGLAGFLSVQITHDTAAGVIFLSLTQFAFAVFATSVTVHRFFTLPFNQEAPVSDTNGSATDAQGAHTSSGLGAIPRLLVLLFLAACPTIFASTITLAKNPLFSFACLWCVGIVYDISARGMNRTRGAALVVGTVLLLVNAKFGIYFAIVILIVAILLRTTDWKRLLATIGIPIIIVQSGLFAFTSTGLVMHDDTIETKAIQIQQLARVVKYAPDSLSVQEKRELSKLFNLKTMAKVYDPTIADPVKSSGKTVPVSYRWKSVTPEDWKTFTSLWLHIGMKNPIGYFDAFFAKTYGYFDITDTSTSTAISYLNQKYNKNPASYTKYFRVSGVISSAPAPMRHGASLALKTWYRTPIIGTLAHANLWVIATLLLLCVQLKRKDFKKLLLEVPVILQYGILIISPANNFERYTIGIVLSFVFVAILTASPRTKFVRKRRVDLRPVEATISGRPTVELRTGSPSKA